MLDRWEVPKSTRTCGFKTYGKLLFGSQPSQRTARYEEIAAAAKVTLVVGQKGLSYA